MTDPVASSLLSPGAGLVTRLMAKAGRLESTFYRPDVATAKLLRAAAQSLQAATARAEQADQVRLEALALVEKLAEVHADPRYQWVWQCAQLHTGPYEGPTYEAELKALASLLTRPPTER